MLQRESVLNFKNQYLDRLRDDPDRDLKLPPAPLIAPDGRINLEDFGFLLERDANVLHRLTNADLRFRCLVGWMEVRNALHLRFQEQLQVFQRTANPPAQKDDYDDVREFIGRSMELQLRHLTDAIFDVAEDAETGNRKAELLLREIGARDYPNDRLFKIEDVPPDKRGKDPYPPAPSSSGKG